MIYSRNIMPDGTIYEDFEGEVEDIKELIEFLDNFGGEYMQHYNPCGCEDYMAEEVFDEAMKQISELKLGF